MVTSLTVKPADEGWIPGRSISFFWGGGGGGAFLRGPSPRHVSLAV